jgi:membrane protease YdiL (CAAX protease family)
MILALWVRFPYVQWNGLICVSVATTLIVVLWERKRWGLGLFVPPGLALREFLLGSAWGGILISSAALLIVWTTGVHHEPGRGFPWAELVAVYIPAVFHEELLCRGYLFQKLYRWNRWTAILGMGLIFAALHLGNSAVSAIGLANIFVGGILLGLAYDRFERLWFPIGLHLAWNVVSGPLLGHEVSGFGSMRSVLIEVDQGPVWLTGGDFGIEGSVWTTAAALVAVVLLIWLERRSRRPRPVSGVLPGQR